MAKVLSYLLKQYDPKDIEVFLKAKFILITIVFVIAGVITSLVYTAYLSGFNKFAILTELGGLAVMLWALVILVKGNYNAAIHIILVSGFSTIWGVLFVKSGISILTKLDTIVFVIGLLAATPFMFSKTRKPIVFYFAANMVVLFLFCYHLHISTDLSRIEILEYLFDNLIVMSFVFLLSFNLFSIYSQGLRSLRKELEERKHTENINKTLFSIANTVNITLNLKELYQQTHHLLSHIINVDNFFIALVNETKTTLHFPYLVDTVDKDNSPIRGFDPGRSLTGLVVSEQKAILLDSEKLKALADKNCVCGTLPLIWMGVPLMIKNDVIGVIAVQSYTDPELYNEQDLKLMSSISDQIAIAIDRKRAEDELRESERKYRYLFDNAPVGMYEINFVKGRFTDVNDTFIKETGYTKKELFSLNPYDLLTAESRLQFEKRYDMLLKGQTLSTEYEYEIFAKNGQKLSVLLNSDYIYDNNQLKGARVVAHNVTERKKIQQIIMQSEKMMSIGGLAAGMAHEINNPLAGIMQNTQLIRNRLTRDMPANDNAALESGTSMNSIREFIQKRKILSSLDSIFNAGSHAAKIVDNMLSFAKKGDALRAKHNLAQLVEKTLELAHNDYDLKNNFNFRQIDIIKAFDPHIPDVPCEESKIMQVFFNIIKNASDFMSETKEIKQPTLIFRLRKLEEMVQIEIQDNGPGMDESVRKRVFEPFFTTKGIKKGTGLGLSLSYFIIVEDHNGEMAVESGLGQGCKFIIRLPLSENKNHRRA